MRLSERGLTATLTAASADEAKEAPERLDFSRDSLVPLWAWMVPRLRKLRDGEQPDRPAAGLVRPA